MVPSISRCAWFCVILVLPVPELRFLRLEDCAGYRLDLDRLDELVEARPWYAQELVSGDGFYAGNYTEPKRALIFLANPNNPTGTWIDGDRLKSFLESVPRETLVVVDEAYAEYVEEPGYPDCCAWLREHPNLVVTRTFSKAFGLAGLRIGYALSAPGVADILNRIRQPFNVNSVAQAAGVAALEDRSYLARSVEINNAERHRVAAAFDSLGLRHVPSVGNFILVDFERPAAPIYKALLRRAVIVRPVANYGLPQHLRITVGTEAQNERLLEALEPALKSAVQA